MADVVDAVQQLLALLVVHVLPWSSNNQNILRYVKRRPNTYPTFRSDDLERVALVEELARRPQKLPPQLERLEEGDLLDLGDLGAGEQRRGGRRRRSHRIVLGSVALACSSSGSAPLLAGLRHLPCCLQRRRPPPLSSIAERRKDDGDGASWKRRRRRREHED